MQWFYFAVWSIVIFSFLYLLQRRIAVDAKYPRATAIVFNLFGAVFAIFLSFITGGFKNLAWPHISVAWIFMLLAALFYALYERGRFVSAKLLDASTLSIVSYTTLAVAFVGSLFIYHEILTPSKIIGVILIAISLILVSFQKSIHKKVSLKGIIFSILIFTSLGFAVMLDKKGAVFFTPSTYSILVWTVPLIMIYFPFIKTREIVYEAKTASWKVVVLAGLNVVGYYFQLRALQIADATQVIPLIQTSTLLTVLLGIVILGEKDNLWKKIFAALIGLAGAYLLVVG